MVLVDTYYLKKMMYNYFNYLHYYFLGLLGLKNYIIIQMNYYIMYQSHIIFIYRICL